MSDGSSSTIYVGNLPIDIRHSEIGNLFSKYGKIMRIDLKTPRSPPGYCFVKFESSRDAEDAIKGRDGYKFDGRPMRVELTNGCRGRSGGGSRARFGAILRPEYQASYDANTADELNPVIVTGFPSSMSCQDLKDHMRKAGDVCFAELSRDSDGIFGLVEYTNNGDVKYAIRELDGTDLKNPFARSYIQVKQYARDRSRSRSRSRSPRGRRGRSRSRTRANSRSRSG